MDIGQAVYEILTKANSTDMKKFYDDYLYEKQILDKEDPDAKQPKQNINWCKFNHAGTSYEFRTYTSGKSNGMSEYFSTLIQCGNLSLDEKLLPYLKDLKKSTDAIRETEIYTFPEGNYIEIVKHPKSLSLAHRNKYNGYITCIDITDKTPSKEEIANREPTRPEGWFDK